VFTDENGFLDETAYVELVAQAIAALHGFHQPVGEREHHRGFLLGAKNFVVSDQARAGDVLEIDLRKIGRLGDFGVVGGTVYRGDAEAARGEVTVWQTSEGAEQP
jgi:predicted hotdog family 3-hydroxylacyl-ACP dehydratase